ncbi:hypothetical protein LCGC14_2760670 [marine sediment metagenome]|uniref:Uncharacterized protein n=1 Tax=marine sediment metagenome TaxID=412755 RepID=A0A0F9B7M9_9ZZZZ
MEKKTINAGLYFVDMGVLGIVAIIGFAAGFKWLGILWAGKLERGRGVLN